MFSAIPVPVHSPSARRRLTAEHSWPLQPGHGRVQALKPSPRANPELADMISGGQGWHLLLPVHLSWTPPLRLTAWRGASLEAWAGNPGGWNTSRRTEGAGGAGPSRYPRRWNDFWLSKK